MARYHVGDVVTVRPDLMAYTHKYLMDYPGSTGFIAVPKMKNFEGRPVTITHVDPDDMSYGIEQDGGEFFWTDEMFVDSFLPDDGDDIEPDDQAWSDFMSGFLYDK